jgi:hypothetical protein
MGWSRRKRRQHAPSKCEPFSPRKHARAANERGWDYLPRQCAECNHLFVPQREEQVMCNDCLAWLVKQLT